MSYIEKIKQIKYCKKLYAKYGALYLVAEQLNITTMDVIHILLDGENKGLFKINISKVKRNKFPRILNVYKIFNETGTLRKTADKLGITHERVRQLLVQGEKYGLFKYISRNVKKNNNLHRLKKYYNKENIKDMILEYGSKSNICSTMNIKMNDLNALFDYYDININEQRKLCSKKRYIQQYMKIVEILGRHPSTTEMNQRKDWRKVWAGIDRYWINFENFRKEYGIKRPKYKLHPNTINAFNLWVQKSKNNRDKRIKMLDDFIYENKITNFKIIKKEFNLGDETLYKYINQLIIKGSIKRIGKGSKVLYITNLFI